MSFLNSIGEYLLSSPWANCLNSLGAVPSLIINPWDTCVTAFLGLLLSNKTMFRLVLPNTGAEFRPAGPQPIIALSNNMSHQLIRIILLNLYPVLL